MICNVFETLGNFLNTLNKMFNEFLQIQENLPFPSECFIYMFICFYYH